MLNNCYTLRHSPVFRNPKSNVAVQHLSQIINETNGRLSPLQPKKIVGIKKNSTDHQLPLCEVPFQTNLYAFNENDMSYSNRANIQTTRQFSRNQRTQSVYACNKENYVRSPQRSPFIKPIIQKECYTPIYSKSPIQRVQSPIIQHTIRQTNQKGFGSISPLRVQQRPKEPLSEMVDNLKQNIMRDIQQVTQKYKEPQKYDEVKIQEFKKQQYLEQQAQLLQQQLEFIKQQQQKISQPKSSCSQEPLAFLKSLESQNKSQIYNEQLSNFQSLKQDSNKLKQMQEIKKFTYDHQSIQQQLLDRAQQQNKFTTQIDQLQKLNNKVESIQRQQNQIQDYLKPEETIERSTSLFTKQVSTAQIELAKLKNLQLELMQNKPLFEQPKQSKFDFNFKQENTQNNYVKQENVQKFSDFAIKQENQQKFQDKQENQLKFQDKQENQQKFQDFNYKQEKLEDYNQYVQKQNYKFENIKQKNEDYSLQDNKIEEFNFESFNFKNRQQEQQKFIQSKKLPAYLKAAKEIDEEGNNTISNISSIIPADVSAQQNKKINVSFESMIDQQQDFLKGAYCRNTFGPLQLEKILRSPCQPEFDLNSSRQKKNFIKEQYCDDENLQCVYKNDSQQCTAEKQESIIQTKQSIESKLDIQLENNNNSINSINGTNSKNNNSYYKQNSKQNTVEKQNRTLEKTYSSEKQNTQQEKQNTLQEKQNTQEKLNTQQERQNTLQDRQYTQERQNTQQERYRTSEKQENSVQNVQPFQRDSEQRSKTLSSGKRYSGFKEQQVERNTNSGNSNNSQQRYEQILQNIQSIKAQKVEISNDDKVKESMKVNDVCQHISDFVIYTEQPQEIKKKTVTFNEQLIQEFKTEKIANFSDFMKSNTLEQIEKPQEILEISKLQPKGISFLQYKQQMES